MPPSMKILSPVIKSLALLARNTASPLKSSGSLHRPIDVLATTLAEKSLSWYKSSHILVWTKLQVVSKGANNPHWYVPWTDCVAGNAPTSPLVTNSPGQVLNSGLATAVNGYVRLRKEGCNGSKVDDLSRSIQTEHLAAKLLDGQVCSSEVDSHDLRQC